MPRDPLLESLASRRSFYVSGRRSLDKHPDRMAYGAMNAEAERAGMHPETFRKARQFAETYTHRALEDLCQLCERHNYAMGVSHAIKLLSVPKPQRAAFQKQEDSEPEPARDSWPSPF